MLELLQSIVLGFYISWHSCGFGGIFCWIFLDIYSTFEESVTNSSIHLCAKMQNKLLKSRICMKGGSSVGRYLEHPFLEC